MKPLLAITLTIISSIVAIAAPPNRVTEELDIRESTFRYQFGKNASGKQQHARAYYLEINTAKKEIDLDDAFMKRFAECKPSVKKASECTVGDKGIMDKKTGESGILFYTGTIKWVSDTEVEISGGAYDGDFSVPSDAYRLKNVHGKWKVIKEVAGGWIVCMSKENQLMRR